MTDTAAAGSPDQDRERIDRTLIALVAAEGYRNVDFEQMLEATGVDAPGFGTHYESLESCFDQVWQRLTGEFLEQTGGAYAAAGDWRDGLRAAAWAYVRFLQADHDRARFLIDVTYASEAVHASRDFVMNSYAHLVHLGNAERPDSPAVEFVVAEGIVGAIWEWVSNGVRSDGFDQLPEQVPDMMYLTVRPYLGLEAAAAEMRRGPEDRRRFERGEI
jgi:AcrR family transcriptional regulator